MSPWFDRPLSIAGRAVIRENSGGKKILTQRLVDFSRNLVLIPNLAIHMDRETNEGRKINVQNEIQPILSTDESASLKNLIAQELGVGDESIVSHDLFLYNRTQPCFWGKDNEFISSAKLDDLECAWTTLKGFLESGGECGFVKVHAVFDNEEVGSQTMQGAASTFLSDTLKRICLSLGKSGDEYFSILARSFMVSADNAHALHPNYADKSDLVNRPKINGGIVIKFNAAQKYTTDAVSSAVFKEICREAGVPFQTFTNNSNIAGGSTLGNISTTQVSIPCVDIGLAQWAMHSPYESAGARDVEHMVRATKAFFEADTEIQ